MLPAGICSLSNSINMSVNTAPLPGGRRCKKYKILEILVIDITGIASCWEYERDSSRQAQSWSCDSRGMETPANLTEG